MRKVIVLMLGALLLSGCTIRTAGLTIASTKNYNLNGGKFYEGEHVTAEDSYPVIIFLLGIPNVKTAADRAIEKNRCAVGLSDIAVTQLDHSFLFGKIDLCVKDDLMINHSLPGCENTS